MNIINKYIKFKYKELLKYYIIIINNWMIIIKINIKNNIIYNN